MGNFYTNVTLRTGDARAVADALRDLRRDAYVTPPERGCVVVFDRETDENPSGLTKLVAELTRRLGCAGLAVANVDDDVLWYGLHERGNRLDEYDSHPSYDRGTMPPAAPEGGDAARLCAAFGAAGREAAVREVLHAARRPMFEVDRHQALAEALGLPMVAVGGGYNYVYQGDVQDVAAENFLLVGDAPQPDSPPPPPRAAERGANERRPRAEDVFLDISVGGLPAGTRLRPSPALAAIVGEEVLRPHEIIMRVSQYVMMNGLWTFGIPPVVRLDAKLRAVCGERDTITLTELLPAVLVVGRTVTIVE